MRRVCRPWPLLVLVALAGLFGPQAVASASDAGLRQLAIDQRAAEKRYEARAENAVKGLSTAVQASRTAAQAGRRLARSLDRIAAAVRGVRGSFDRYAARFAAEAPETNEASVGRTLMVRGLRDGIASLRRQERFARRAASRFRRVRTYPGLGRVSRQLDRDNNREDATAERSEKRLKRGRTLIRTAPVPPAPVAPAA